MRTTSNPAFRNLPLGGGYAAFTNRPTAAGYAGYPGPAPSYAPSAAGGRPLTLDDVVTKTSITAGVALVAGLLTAATHAYVLALPALLVGLVLAMVIIFRSSSNPALVLGYAVAEGVLLGAITGLFNRIYPGIAMEAIVGTVGVFLGMLVVYKTGAIRVTPRLTRMVTGALIGVLVLMLANFVGNLFHFDMGLRSGGPIAIIFSLVVIGVAAFSLLLDFDMADRAIKAGAPARLGWYIAFGLLVTLVWLYLEILRLLSYFARQN